MNNPALRYSPMREHIHRIISAIIPYDDVEQEHINDTCLWIESGEPIFRVQKPDVPNKHLVSYFVLFDDVHQKILLVDHKKALLKTDDAILLHPKLVREMITRQLPSEKIDEPGLGFFIKNDGDDLVFLHYGQDEGFIANFYGFASRDQGVVIMMNNDAGWTLMDEIKNSIADTYEWPNFTPIKKKSLPPNTSILNHLQGKFASQDEEIEVRIVGDKLYGHFQFSQPAELFPQRDNVYFIREEDITLEFVIAPSNVIESVVLTHPNQQKTVFQRV